MSFQVDSQTLFEFSLTHVAFNLSQDASPFIVDDRGSTDIDHHMLSPRDLDGNGLTQCITFQSNLSLAVQELLP